MIAPAPYEFCLFIALAFLVGCMVGMAFSQWIHEKIRLSRLDRELGI